MDWNTEKYTEFRQQYEIKYRYYDNIQLDAEEFNLREQLEETKHGSDIIYYNIALAYFAALLVLPQVIDEKFGIDPSNLSALKIICGRYSLCRIISITTSKRNIYEHWNL